MTRPLTDEQRAAARERNRRYRERHRERYLKEHREAMRRLRAEGRINDTEWRKAWRAANPDKVTAMNRRASRKYAAAHPEEERERRKRFREANPDYGRARREIAREQERAYRQRNPHMRPWRRRRLAKAGILLVINVSSTECGVCFEPLTDLPYPDPMATSIGHEPPLIIAQREGWTTVVERPEHLICNLRKGERTDCDHAATARPALAHSIKLVAAR